MDVADANISIAFAGTERFVVQVIVKCPEVVDVTIHLITLSRPSDQRQTIHSQYQWSSGDFISPLSSTPVTFQYGAVAPIVSSWVEFTAAEGSNLMPTDLSRLTMIYNRIFPDNYTLRASDRFRMLRGNTKYTEANIAALLADAALRTTIPAGAQPEYTGTFAPFPSTGDYLYLIWDYSN